MFIEKNHRVKIEDAEKGCFLRVTLKGKQTEIGRPKASRAVCIYRCNACFTDAIALDSFDCIPSKTLFVLSEYEGVYSLLYMLEDQGCSCSLSGREGKIFLDAEGEEDRPDKSYPVRAAYSVSGQNVYELISAAADILSRSFPRLKKKSEKRTSDFLGKLGFCTYNAFYENVTEQKILAVLDAAKSKGVQFGFLIVDSGWMQEKEEKLSAFDPDGRKFPAGFKEFSEKLRTDYGIEKLFIWHTFYGFWTGIEEKLGFPVQKQIFNEAYSTPSEMPAEYIGGINTAGEDFYPLNISGKVCQFPRSENLSEFYRSFYAALCLNGVKGAKVDAISWLELFGRGNGGQVRIMDQYLRTIEKFGEDYFKGNLICCSSESVDFLLHSGDLSLIRVCKDYMPDNAATFGPHIYFAAINSLWLGEFFFCDYDMFQSGGRGGRMHAINRAVSGGPIYCSDNLETLDFSVLRALASRDGFVPVCDTYARPTERSIFVNVFTEKKLFMQFNRLGGCYLMAVYNCSREDVGIIFDCFTISEITFSQDCPARRFAVYSSERRFLGIFGREDPVTVSLGFLQAELFSILPLKEDCFTWIGEEGKLIPFGFLTVETGRNSFQVSVKEAGKYLLYTESKIKKSSLPFLETQGNLYAFYAPKAGEFSVVTGGKLLPAIGVGAGKVADRTGDAEVKSIRHNRWKEVSEM